jgi:chromosome segregation ATPase
MNIRSRVERFLSLLARNSAIRKRIEDARSEFDITSNLLSELRMTITTVEEKMKLVGDTTTQLQAAKTDLKAELQKQRDEY